MVLIVPLCSLEVVTACIDIARALQVFIAFKDPAMSVGFLLPEIVLLASLTKYYIKVFRQFITFKENNGFCVSVKPDILKNRNHRCHEF